MASPRLASAFAYFRKRLFRASLLAFLFVLVVNPSEVLAISFGAFVSKSTNTHTTGFNATTFGDIDNDGTLDWSARARPAS
jgi:hypothetical protein